MCRTGNAVSDDPIKCSEVHGHADVLLVIDSVLQMKVGERNRIVSGLLLSSRPLIGHVECSIFKMQS